ncbi:hypothetical protein BJ878DRAFT_556828 [Calycina marina]|uniref:Uncharacterized protein n=1 Tax=Calycina marina TaxID=1763456 RepID=A0A9P8CJ73_9HELO|nr:hypothetical protein BJ878DRAFT_556828 [Calycina marina]
MRNRTLITTQMRPTRDQEWTFVLSEEHLLEIQDGLLHFESHSGRDFFVLRDLQPSSQRTKENIIIYAGVPSYTGYVRGRQNSKLVSGEKKSSMLNHIKDLSQPAVAGTIGGHAYTTDTPMFHTYAGDIIAATHPKIIATLWDNRDFYSYVNKETPYTSSPLLYHQPAGEARIENVIVQYARRGFTGFLHLPRSRNISPIPEVQAEALDTLHFLADRCSFALNFQKDGIQSVDKLSIFLARDRFVDTPDQQKHLLRLGFNNPELAWETLGLHKQRWDELYKDATEEEQVLPLESFVKGGAGKA